MKTYADCMAERADMWTGSDHTAAVNKIVAALARAIRGGGRAYFFGNGGSAAQAQHLAAELSGRFLLERPAWGGLALSVDTSALTAIANDYGYDQVFARQISGLAKPGDVAVGLTTSGKSPNVIAGLRAARENGAATIAFTGNGGGPVCDVADVSLVGPTGPSWKVQEVHLTLGHVVCELLELELTRVKNPS
jgi:D-sedoheptulose 7-phosphate isomerase